MAETTHLPIDKPNRREFLYYAGGASLALLAAGSCGVLTRFMNPSLRGEKDGIFRVNLEKIPGINTNPVRMREGQYWLVNLDDGMIALRGACSLEGTPQLCPSRWVPTESRFICPCCGSKYELDGTYIEGPSKRGLDRFTLEVTMPEDSLTTPSDGSPVNIIGAKQIIVDTNRIIYGQARQG
jgi:cytochrome b6-f complex iron-sulfur subunit